MATYPVCGNNQVTSVTQASGGVCTAPVYGNGPNGTIVVLGTCGAVVTQNEYVTTSLSR